MQMTAALIGGVSADPKMEILGEAEREFSDAGVCLAGVWNAEWLGYLSAAWLPEAAQWYAHAMAQPWAETARRNTVAGIGAKLAARRDDD
ncbi:MAG: hypothetical protein FDZ70_00495 [Actinobacteria bacterium]|nr:MAG: hypothetical protein FDZ70_00495 [Actinomycetota bacterium]